MKLGLEPARSVSVALKKRRIALPTRHLETKLRWKIDALPDPTQLTENRISAEVGVRRNFVITTGRVICAPMANVQVTALEIVGVPELELVRVIRDGATDGATAVIEKMAREGSDREAYPTGIRLTGEAEAAPVKHLSSRMRSRSHRMPR